jgi:exopolyphosphatase/guanosine-5'-triphosphate,3'-diphosphate pyrophosphatase
VGGGSTEISVSYRGKILELRSFKLGTVRILNNYDETVEWAALKEYLKELDEKFKKVIAVGSGGNINKLSKLFGSKGAKELSYREIDDGVRRLETMSIDERIAVLGLRHDRADVIVPAGTIFLTIMKHLRVSKILVPRIGLADGMIRNLYHAHNGSSVAPSGATIRYLE